MMKNDKNLSKFDLTGPRHSKIDNREKVQEIAALTFFENLLDSFETVKEFCKNHPLNEECAILETDRILISELFMK